MQILFHHCRCAHVEIDILAERAGELWIVEVKSSRHADFGSTRLNYKQRLRLERAAAQCSQAGFDVRVVLALIEHRHSIQWIDALSAEEIR